MRFPFESLWTFLILSIPILVWKLSKAQEQKAKRRPSAGEGFSFQITGREDVTGRCHEGEFCMFIARSAYLPTKEKWQLIAPKWAQGRWEEVHSQFRAWCIKREMPLVVDDSHDVYAFREFNSEHRA